MFQENSDQKNAHELRSNGRCGKERKITRGIPRRRFIQSTAGIGASAFAGISSAQTSQAQEGGEEIWSFETDGSVFSSPSIVDGQIYFGSRDHHIYALDAATGDEIWNFQKIFICVPLLL